MKVIDEINEKNRVKDLQPGDVLKCIGKYGTDYWLYIYVPEGELKPEERATPKLKFSLIDLKGGGVFCDKWETTAFASTSDLLAAIGEPYKRIEKVDATLIVQEEC